MEELSQHLLDIVINSVEAGATGIKITITENIPTNKLSIEVLDNGRGLKEEEIKYILDPFYTTKRNKRIGLGLPLFQESAERCGGDFQIKTLPQGGTRVSATFPHNHIDRAPLGDIGGTLITLLLSNDEIDFIYQHHYNDKVFIFDTKQLRAKMRDIPLRTPEVIVWLQDYLDEQICALKEVKTDEKFG